MKIMLIYIGKVRDLFTLCTVFLLLSCATGVSQKSSGKSSFRDDLSAFRPKYAPDTAKQVAVTKEVAPAPLDPSLDITADLNKKLAAISANSPKVAKGYRILLYSGNSKEEAMAIKDKAQNIISDKVYVEYKAPNFRVKAGDALNRLEANYLKGKLQHDFSNGVIVPDDVNINVN